MISKAESIALGLLIAVYAVAAYGEERVPEQGVLEEVIVFAQKREQPLLEVPISISTLSGVEMEAAGIYSIDDISRLIPNLEVQTNVNSVQSTFRIRRVGSLGNIPTFEPAVGVFMDGAFRSRSVFATSELFDLERGQCGGRAERPGRISQRRAALAAGKQGRQAGYLTKMGRAFHKQLLAQRSSVGCFIVSLSAYTARAAIRPVMSMPNRRQGMLRRLKATWNEHWDPAAA